MFHLYSTNGFESAHKTMAAAKRAADKARKAGHATNLRVVETNAAGETTGAERPVYVPGA